MGFSVRSQNRLKKTFLVRIAYFSSARYSPLLLPLSDTISWPGHWPLIGRERSRDKDTGLWLVECDHVTWILASDWASVIYFWRFWSRGFYNCNWSVWIFMASNPKLTRCINIEILFAHKLSVLCINAYLWLSRGEEWASLYSPCLYHLFHTLLGCIIIKTIRKTMSGPGLRHLVWWHLGLFPFRL